MEIVNPNNDKIIEYLIRNSIFTKKQIEIIYRQRGKERSRGSYYRVLGQCKNNIKRVLFSIILLEMLGVINNEKKSVLEKVIYQLHSINDSNIDVTNVISILDEIIKRLSKI